MTAIYPLRDDVPIPHRFRRSGLRPGPMRTKLHQTLLTMSAGQSFVVPTEDFPGVTIDKLQNKVSAMGIRVLGTGSITTRMVEHGVMTWKHLE